MKGKFNCLKIKTGTENEAYQTQFDKTYKYDEVSFSKAQLYSTSGIEAKDLTLNISVPINK